MEDRHSSGPVGHCQVGIAEERHTMGFGPLAAGELRESGGPESGFLNGDTIQEVDELESEAGQSEASAVGGKRQVFRAPDSTEGLENVGRCHQRYGLHLHNTLLKKLQVIGARISL